MHDYDEALDQSVFRWAKDDEPMVGSYEQAYREGYEAGNDWANEGWTNAALQEITGRQAVTA